MLNLLNFSTLTKMLAILKQKFEIAELCKGVHCVDLGESFQTHIFLQNLASIQPRTSPVKFARPYSRSPLTPSGQVHEEGGRLVLIPSRDRGVAAGCGKLYRARSRLYRNEILQENIRLKALAEIYTMHSIFEILQE